MTIASRTLLAASLALLFCGAVAAADAPKEPPKDAKAEQKDEKKDEKKDGKDGKEAKAEAPAEPELPSKPYPKNVSPKAFAPKGDTAKTSAKAETEGEKAGDKPADKGGEKGGDKHADKGGDKHADKGGDKHAEKGGEKHADKHDAAHEKSPKKRKVAGHSRAKSVPVAADPALQQLVKESLPAEASAQPKSYVVQPRDTLDNVIRNTLPATPFSMEVLREAFVRANPQLRAPVKTVKLKPGQVLQVPSVAVMRQVVLGESPAASGESDKKPSLHAEAPVVAPTIAPGAPVLNPPIAEPRLPVTVAGSDRPVPEVSPEEKKKWVRYP